MEKFQRNAPQIYTEAEFQIGLILAISSSLFIGTSFILKKKVLIQISRSGNLRAGAGGFGYLKEWMWWAGFILMGIGEAANFTAYAFAPASLVTPLGALSVLVTAVLSSKCLNEKLNIIGKLGCFLCILGSTVIVIHSPKDDEVESLTVLIPKLQDPLFLCYVFFVVSVTCSVVFYFGPKYGSQNVVVYIIVCSAVGSLTVMSCKCLGLALRESIAGQNQFTNFLPYGFMIAVIVCVCIQMDYLNKALDLFNTSIVMPIYYVFFTTLVIIASAILFKEWQNMSVKDVLGNLCGFSVIIVGIILLQAFRDFDVSFHDVRGMLSPKHETAIKPLLLNKKFTYGSQRTFTRSV